MKITRFALTALAFAAVGSAHAFEATEFPLEKGMLSRADVQAGSHLAAAAAGEAYDGLQGNTAPMALSTLKREEVRLQARLGRTTADDYIGG